MLLAVIDYGAGNLRSVLHALDTLGVEHVRIVHTPHQLRGVDKIILPGVGAFGAGMGQLRAQGLINPLCGLVNAGTPYLGICLGMQFLFERSDELGSHEGLGLLPGVVARLPAHPGLKTPHMGWNQLQAHRASALLTGVSEAAYVYFVHSYHCLPARPDDILLTVDYGEPVVAAVGHDGIYGVQFHPEKSQRAGLRILSNFLEL